MQTCKRPGALAGARGPQECVSAKSCSPEHSTEALIGKQAARIIRQFGVSPALAVTIAEIAFDHGRSA